MSWRTSIARFINRPDVAKVIIVGLAIVLFRYQLIGVSGVIGYLSGVVQDPTVFVLFVAAGVIGFPALYRWYVRVSVAPKATRDHVSTTDENP